MRSALTTALLVVLAGCGRRRSSRSRPRRFTRSRRRARCSRTRRRGRTTETFTREHAKALRKLLRPGRAGDRGRAARRTADDVDAALGELADDPGDEAHRRRLERRLDEAAEPQTSCRMKDIFSIALGILAAIGGFVDIGDIVFNVAAGATFGYQLLWAVVIGVGGIITYAEMCGRVAAVSEKAVFDAVRERLGFSVGLVALVAGQLVNLLTLAAEIGGVAIVLQLLSGLPYRALLVLAVLVLGARPLADAVRVDRARLRLLRPRAARLRGRRGQAPSGLGRGRARLRPVDRHAATAGSTPTSSSAWSGRR